MTEKDIKRRIRMLRKFKRDIRIGTDARREINHKIRELKEKLGYDEITPEKTNLIKKINAVYKHYNDLRKFTVEQLRFHLEKITQKGGIK